MLTFKIFLRPQRNKHLYNVGLHRLDRELRVKVADFGLCRDIYEKGYYHSDNKKKLPIRWMAIESIEKGTYTSKSDVVRWEKLKSEKILTYICQTLCVYIPVRLKKLHIHVYLLHLFMLDSGVCVVKFSSTWEKTLVAKICHWKTRVSKWFN